MASASQSLLDAQIRHAIGLQRLIAGQAARRVEQWHKDLNAIAALYVSRGMQPPRVELDAIVDEIEAFVLGSYRKQAEALIAALAGLIALEAGFQVGLLDQVTADDVPIVAPHRNELALIVDQSFEGHGVAAWATILGFQHFQRARDHLLNVSRGGGDTADAVKGLQKATSKGVGHLATWARSMLGLGAGEASDAVTEANLALFEFLVWVGILDSRITPHICLPRDGKLYDVVTKAPIAHALSWGAGPGRIHRQCRSSSSQVFRGDLAPGKVTAEEWLRRQPRSDIDEVFGAKRADLWLRGELEAEDMLRPDGRSFFTLDELQSFDSTAPPPVLDAVA